MSSSASGPVSGRVRVGVIGAGAMGAAHAATLADAVPAAELVAVFDADTARAEQVAGEVGASAAASAEELIGSVDAVVVAAPDRFHADLVIACVDAGKPVLCEKPLAVTGADARRVVDAEIAAVGATGGRLVSVGFNRRFDPGFVALKRTVTDGSVGAVRLLHGVHRNASNATSTDDAGLVTGSMIHEFDTFAWLLDDDVAAIRVESPVTEGFRDPQVATIWMASGPMITAEVFVNAGYGYDVRVEVVGSGGSAMLEPRTPVVTRVSGTAGTAVGSDFVAHFAESYRLELAAWARAAAGPPEGGGSDRAVGASAWDGYVATLVAESGVAALRSGERQRVEIPERPALYAR